MTAPSNRRGQAQQLLVLLVVVLLLLELLVVQSGQRAAPTHVVKSNAVLV